MCQYRVLISCGSGACKHKQWTPTKPCTLYMPLRARFTKKGFWGLNCQLVSTTLSYTPKLSAHCMNARSLWSEENQTAGWGVNLHSNLEFVNTQDRSVLCTSLGTQNKICKSCSKSSGLSSAEIHTLGAMESISLQAQMSAAFYKSCNSSFSDEAGGRSTMQRYSSPLLRWLRACPSQPVMIPHGGPRWKQCSFASLASRSRPFCSTRTGQVCRAGAREDQRDRNSLSKSGTEVCWRLHWAWTELLFSIHLTTTMNYLTCGKTGPSDLSVLGGRISNTLLIRWRLKPHEYGQIFIAFSHFMLGIWTEILPYMWPAQQPTGHAAEVLSSTASPSSSPGHSFAVWMLASLWSNSMIQQTYPQSEQTSHGPTISITALYI